MNRLKRYERYKDSGVEWIGEIPEEWEIKKLKHICSESAVYGLNESAENYIEEGVRFIRTTDIDDKGNLDNNVEGVFLSEEKVKGYILKTGDLLVSRSGSLGISLYFDEDKYGKCSYAGYLVKFRANSKNCSKFLFYFSKSNIFYIQIELALVSSTISNFNGNKYANMMVPLPNYYEQKAIANFLDQKTTEIDDLIADKEKLIELLQEKRQAIITEAVTKGLNSNVRMKDSGVEWIGEIPEHWEVKPLFTLLTERKVKNIGIAEKNVLSLSYGRIIRRHIESNYGLLPESFETYQIVDPGNIILRLTDLQNDHRSLRCGLVTERGIITSAYVALESNSKINGTYAYNLLHTYDLLKIFYGMGDGVRQSMSYKDLKWMPIILPPLYEQEAICNYISEKVRIMDDLVSDINTQIQKLKEYRQSLISEAVTGKIDVRDYDVNN